MIQIGDKVTIQWFPWSSHPITVEKKVWFDKVVRKMGPIERMGYISPKSPIFDRMQLGQNPGYVRINNQNKLPEIYQFKTIKIEKMSEAEEPMKTIYDKINNLNHISDLLKKYTIKIDKPDKLQIGDTCLIWMTHIIDENKSESFPVEVIVDEGVLEDLSLRMNKGGLLDFVKIKPEPIFKERTLNKKQRKTWKSNECELKKKRKHIKHIHQRNVMSLGKPKPQVNKLHKIENYIVEIKFFGLELDRRKQFPRFTNPIYRQVKALNSADAYKKIEARYKGAEFTIKKWKDTLGTPWRRSSLRRAPRPLKTDDSNLHADLRMVCIKHIATGEVQRIKWYQAECILSKDHNWDFCPKWEWKRHINKQVDLAKNDIKTGLHKGPFTRDIFTRREGRRIRKLKGIPGNRRTKTQSISKIIKSKKVRVDIFKPIFDIKERLIPHIGRMYQITDGKKGLPPNSFTKKKIEVIFEGFEKVNTVEFEKPEKTIISKTLKITNYQQKTRIKLNTAESAFLREEKDKIRLERIHNRNQRNTNRLEHKLYKRKPHLSTKDKIKLKRMLRVKKKK